MHKKFLRTGVVLILTYTFYIWVKTVGIYSNASVEEKQIVSVRSERLKVEKEERESDEAESQPIEKTEGESDITEGLPPELERYYGMYQVVEFCPSIYYKVQKFDFLPKQEADMIVGRIIRIEEDLFLTYDSERREKGPTYFPVNYRIKEFVMEAPQYVWTDNRKELGYRISFMREDQSISKQECNRINGIIHVPDGKQDFYTMEGEDKLILFSWRTFQYFILEKTDEIPKEKEAAALTQEDRKEILDAFFGKYKITEFLPTKYYPTRDPDGIDWLPQEEADMMLGKTILVSKDKCILYDNGGQPNSISMKRGETEYLLNEIMIDPPDYQVDSVIKDDIF